MGKLGTCKNSGPCSSLYNSVICMVGFYYFIQKTQTVVTLYILLQSDLFFSFRRCRYLSLVEGAELYAVVRDSTKAVVSLPPVTNSERSKVRLRKNNPLKIPNTNKTP